MPPCRTWTPYHAVVVYLTLVGLPAHRTPHTPTLPRLPWCLVFPLPPPAASCCTHARTLPTHTVTSLKIMTLPPHAHAHTCHTLPHLHARPPPTHYPHRWRPPGINVPIPSPSLQGARTWWALVETALSSPSTTLPHTPAPHTPHPTPPPLQSSYRFWLSHRLSASRSGEAGRGRRRPQT